MKTTIINRNESYFITDCNTKQEIVLSVIKRLGKCTNRQIAKYLKWEINRVTGRCKELREKGLVVEAGSIYDNKTKRTVTLFSINDNQLKLKF